MTEKQVPERFDWLSNVGAYVKAYGRVRLYTLVVSALGEAWEASDVYEVRVSDGQGVWYPVPAIDVAASEVHHVLAHLHRFSTAEASLISQMRAVMAEDRINAVAYLPAIDAHNERYRAVEAAIVELEEDLYATD